MTHEAPSDDRAALVSALQRPDAYPDRPASVEMVETHISNLFMAGEYVYKVKKPVDFGFCNFTTLELRRDYTFRELELNRRLTDDVHLGVEEVRRDDNGAYSIGGPGTTVEYALKMRHLPPDRTLSTLVRSGLAGEAAVRHIARVIAQFHGRAAQAPEAPGFGSHPMVSDLVLDNVERAAQASGRFTDDATLADVRAYSKAFLDVRRPLFHARFASRRIRECHGDLHAGNVFLENDSSSPDGIKVQVIDCIEFNDSLRFIDPAADIAFMAMDLEHMGRQDLADAFVDEYVKAGGDQGVRPLLPFYMAYRAMVRCLINGLIAGDQPASSTKPEAAEAQSYAELAESIAGRDRPQALFIMAGPTGSGKSTVARLVAERWGIEHFQTDVIRKLLAGLDPAAKTGDGVAAGIYSEQMSHRTYRELENRGARILSQGLPVIMDGTFLRRRHRKSAADVGRRYGVPVVIIECSLEEAETIARLEQRYASDTSESEGRPEVYQRQRGAWQPVRDDEADAVVRVNTAGDQAAMYDRALYDLWRAVLR
ncbi:MAG: AAA family ATPase, partial [Dehalococcoidia bacterium]